MSKGTRNKAARRQKVDVEELIDAKKPFKIEVKSDGEFWTAAIGDMVSRGRYRHDAVYTLARIMQANAYAVIEITKSRKKGAKDESKVPTAKGRKTK